MSSEMDTSSPTIDDGDSGVEETAVDTRRVKKEPVSEDECAAVNQGKSKTFKIKQEPHDDDDCEEVSVSNKSDKDEESSMAMIIKVTLKTPKEKRVVEIETGASVKDLREEASKVFKKPVGQINLIFSGKVLRDPESLTVNDITDGLVVHVVIKDAPKASNDPLSNLPFGLNAYGGIQGLANLGFGSANFLEMQQQMQKELISNPEFLRQVIDNPFVQSLMSNAECIRQIVNSNPEMQQLMERNPEISHMLNNPEVLRQTMDVARNPAMLQALMQPKEAVSSKRENTENESDAENSDAKKAKSGSHSNIDCESRAKNQSNMAGHKTDETVMQETDIDLPLGVKLTLPTQPVLRRSTRKRTSPDRMNSYEKSESSVGVENKAPLPNPWASSETGAESKPSSENEKTSTKTDNTSGSTSKSQGLFTSPGLQSIMQQMMQNPQLVQEMLNAPYMQTVMEALASNPDMATQVMVNNPIFGSNPQIQDQFKRAFPALMQQMQNPDYRNFVTNPHALTAMMNIHQGLDQLQQAAPNMFNMFPSQPPFNLNPVSTPSTETKSAGDAGSGGTEESPSQNTQESFSQFMSYMVNSMAQRNLQLPPEERYQSELQQLQAMGFVNKDANLQALMATFGDVNAAIERIIGTQN